MPIDQTLSPFFKSDALSSGRKLFAQNKTVLSNASDTAAQIYVKDGSSFTVRFSSEDISHDSFTAKCSCVAGKKGRFCKHIWAALLCVEEKHPDFLNAKQNIHKPSVSPDALNTPAKLKAAEYKKVQYERQKEHVKALKQKRKQQENTAATLTAWNIPTEVQIALDYFSVNGFPMPAGPDEAIVGKAKRILSRVFHPDKGGSNEEAIELLRMCDVVLNFLRN